MKPRIGILIRALDLGGAEKQSLLQAKLMRTEFEVYYIIQKKKPRLKQHVDFLTNEKINCIQLSGNIIFRTIQFISCIRKNRIEVVFSFLTTDNVLASMASVFLKAIFVGGIRNSYLPGTKFYITRFLQRFFLDYMIFNNHYGRKVFVEKGFLSAKSVVIQNCISNIQDERIRPDNRCVKILSVGRFTSGKDYLTALKAIRALRDLVPEKEIDYVIVGDGELDNQLQTWIKEMQIARVTLVRLPENIDDFYTAADIYFLSSAFEGMPNTIMEALNYSLPVVSTDVGDVNYLVKEGVNGFLAPAKDYARLAERLSELVLDPAKRNSFGLNGHRFLIKEFSETTYQEQYINFTKKILQNHHPS
jgi:glycosyltransferase involved in cell wall biosynthesis